MNMSSPTMRDVFLEEVIRFMEADDRIMFLTADFGAPTLDVLAGKFPDRCINVGIAEQNLVNLSTGLALEGFTVFAYAIAPFLTMRCYEQIRVNLAILSQVRPLNVNLVGVGAGYSYDLSGASHQALEDISIMRTLPNIEVLSPADWVCAKAFARWCLASKRPKYLRLDGKSLPAVYQELPDAQVKQGFRELRQGDRVCLVSTGCMTHTALAVSRRLLQEGVAVGAVDVFMLKNPDMKMLRDILRQYRYVLSLEEGFIGKGGLDSLVSQCVRECDAAIAFDGLGVKDEYGLRVADRASLHRANRIGEDDIMERIRSHEQACFQKQSV